MGVAGLLVSTLPTWSFKNYKVPRQAVLPLLLGAAGYVALLVAEPWAALAAAGLLYAGMIPFSLRSYHHLRAQLARAAAPEGEAAESPAIP